MFKILIVEDIGAYRGSLREDIEGKFPNVVIEEAANGREALEKADSFRPDLILMDLRLPDKSGLELTKQIKAKFPIVKVAMLTSYDLSEYREAAARYGADYFLAKGAATRDDVHALIKSLISDQETTST